jgi:ketosteroid isomerase-like protein
MSAAENKKLMQEIFAAASRGERAAYVDRLADDVTMTVTGQYSWSRTFRGKESVMRDLYGYVASRVQDGRRTIPLRVLADEDWVVVEARGEMVTKQGERYDNQYCMMYRLRDGMIVEIREYQDSTLCERVLGPYPADRLAAS